MSRFRRTPEEIEAGLTIEQAKELRGLEPVDITEGEVKDGLGDKVEKVLKATGIKAVVEYFNGGEECDGCKKRKAALNALRFRRKPLTITIEEYDYLTKFFNRERKNSVSAIQNVEITKIHARIFQVKGAEVSSCSSCLRQIVKDLTEVYEIYN